MRGIVVDTNVLVSGLITAKGNCALILEYIQEGKLSIYYDARIIDEYHEVLSRPEFGFSQTSIEDLLKMLIQTGVEIIAPASNIALPDEDDRMFVEVAMYAHAYIVTGNTKHFPAIESVLTPAQLVELLVQ